MFLAAYYQGAGRLAARGRRCRVVPAAALGAEGERLLLPCVSAAALGDEARTDLRVLLQTLLCHFCQVSGKMQL